MLSSPVERNLQPCLSLELMDTLQVHLPDRFACHPVCFFVKLFRVFESESAKEPRKFSDSVSGNFRPLTLWSFTEMTLVAS